MRHFLSAMALSAGLAAAPALAQDGPIEGVIQSQIDAFQSGDVAAAFDYASPGIQGMFGSPERFGRMVEQGYPMVWRPSDVEFLDSRPLGDGVIQKVLMRDAEGVPWVLDYQMIEGPEGWLINGVQILTSGELGA